MQSEPTQTATVGIPPSRTASRGLREPVNTVSHSIGAVLAVIGLLVLLGRSDGDARKVAAFSIFMTTMIWQYVSSAALHGLDLASASRRLLKRIDHVAIYFFIAGTYTPLCLLTPETEQGLVALAVVWGMASLGVLFKVFFLDAPRWISVTIYHLACWVSLLACWPLLAYLPIQSAAWCISGCFAYMLGSLVYAMRKPNLIRGVLGHHEILHFMVMGGSTCHYLWMLGYT